MKRETCQWCGRGKRHGVEVVKVETAAGDRRLCADCRQSKLFAVARSVKRCPCGAMTIHDCAGECGILK